MGRGRRVADVGEDWLYDLDGDAVEVPRAGTPDEELRERRFKIVRRWFRFGYMVTPFALLLALVGIMGAFVHTQTVTDAYTSQTRAVALVALQDWLQQDPAPLPGGWVVGWESEENPPAKTATNTKDPLPTVTVHRFTLSDSNGSLYVAQVAVSAVEGAGASVIGSPSLVPMAPPANGTTLDVSWGDLPPAPVSDGMRTGVQVWGEAYLSGNPARLLQAVGDPNAGHTYVPLSGATLVSANVISAAAVWDDPKADHSNQKAKFAVARVSLTYLWGEPKKGLNSATSTMQLDVLIGDADTATPHVVAWGGVGTGQLLRKYGNAVADQQVGPIPTVSAPASASASPGQVPGSTPSGTPSEAQTPAATGSPDGTPSSTPTVAGR